MFEVTQEQVFGATPELEYVFGITADRLALSHSGAGVAVRSHSGASAWSHSGAGVGIWSHSGTSGFSHPGAGVVI